MTDLIILIILALNYIIPYKGLIKISKNEAKILDEYKHIQLKITDSAEDLVAPDTKDMESFDTMNVLGDLDNKEDFTDVDLKDLY